MSPYFYTVTAERLSEGRVEGNGEGSVGDVVEE